MTEKTRILFLSANPWTTGRILVDEEAREIFERIQEGPYRDRFELHKHTATRPIDLQRLLLLHKPHIVHFSGHGSKKQKIILGGSPGRGKTVDQRGLVEVLALYSRHLRLVLLNACFTHAQARSIAEVIDYSVGTGKGIGDKAGVAFAGAFYRALGFGKSIRDAFESARAELVLTKMPRTQGIELFVREGISEKDPFPQQTQHPDSLRNDIFKLSSIHFFAVVETTVTGGKSSKRIRSVALYRSARSAT
ncbi:MAG TPA: CHAT domain-containing protein [Pyrinomonadaceae bacterium]|nr:CHAT domain-containing protein [Pyrinomonadaceae bacterium]